MAALYVLVAILGAVLVFFRDVMAQDPEFEMDATEALVTGVLILLMGMVLAMAFAFGMVWRRGMGGWVYNLVLIAFGMTSCCTCPATIP